MTSLARTGGFVALAIVVLVGGCSREEVYPESDEAAGAAMRELSSRCNAETCPAGVCVRSRGGVRCEAACDEDADCGAGSTCHSWQGLSGRTGYCTTQPVPELDPAERFRKHAHRTR